MLRPKKNSYKEFDNEKKFLRLKNSINTVSTNRDLFREEIPTGVLLKDKISACNSYVSYKCSSVLSKKDLRIIRLNGVVNTETDRASCTVLDMPIVRCGICL